MENDDICPEHGSKSVTPGGGLEVMGLALIPGAFSTQRINILGTP